MNLGEKNTMRPNSTLEVFESHVKTEFLRQEVGGFSLDVRGQLAFDKSSLTYLYDYGGVLTFGLDLNIGYDTFINKDRSFPSNLDNILKWYTAEGKPHNSEVDFISRRGLLKKIMTTPYQREKDWTFVVKKFKGTYYLMELATLHSLQDALNWSPLRKLGSYWGFKFEQYMSTGKPGGVPETNVPVNNYKKFYNVCKNQIGRHSLLFAGEVDCLSQRKGEGYVELKTIRIGANEYGTKRFKYVDWWSQCYLLNINRIVLGLKDDDGVVREVKNLVVDELLKGAIGWNPNVCLNFLDTLLQFVKDVVGDSDSDKLYLFERKFGGSVTWRLIEEGELQGKDGSGEKKEEGVRRKSGESVEDYLQRGNSQLLAGLLPEWYTQLMKD